MTTPEAPYRHLDHANDLEPSVGHAQLRSACPVHHEDDHDPDFYVVSRFAECLDVLRDPGQWGNKDGPGVFYQEGGVLGSTDDPDHARHRRTLRRAFLPSVIARMEPAVARLADAMFDDLIPRGEADFVADYAFPFPALVIGELLGVRVEDRDQFRQWSTLIVNALGGGDLSLYESANQSIWDYIDGLVEERAALLGATSLEADEDPVGSVLPEDVISIMYAAHLRGELSRIEIRRLGQQLLVAGHETTTGLIGLLMWRLAKQPELIDQLRADPSLIDTAVEEALRFDSPVQGLFRTNETDCVVGGVELEAASKLQVLFASANRDPDRWTDADSFRLDRDIRDLRQHLAFGWGTHYCIGAPLARLETRLSLEGILQRMDQIEIMGEPQLNEPFILRGFTSLPIRWTPRP
jgi:cytochrome P450